MSKGVLNIVLVDDEIHVIENLTIILTSYFPEVNIVGTSNNALDAIKLIKKVNPDVVFLDISMPNGSGFDVLDIIGKIDFKVVIVTAYEQYAIEAIRRNAFDYIMKPVDIDELSKCIKNLKAELGEKKEKTELQDHVKLSVCTTKTIEFIKIKNIMYCKSDNTYTSLHLKDLNSVILSKPIKEVENMLPESHFMRCHNSYLINKTYIKKYHKADESLELQTGDYLPLARSKKEKILNWLAS